ncbi:hypothetical protein [Methanothermococcus sp.]|uniref:hypothetical protein n=1 Tax=Methanothermococcus sp. TaxID=2614238 RepID=UPI0025FDE610|nr:hypothetical protein [Methanothermococcus sp.]
MGQFDYNTTTHANKFIIYLCTFYTIFISLMEYYLTKDMLFSICILVFGLTAILLFIHMPINPLK